MNANGRGGQSSIGNQGPFLTSTGHLEGKKEAASGKLQSKRPHRPGSEGDFSWMPHWCCSELAAHMCVLLSCKLLSMSNRLLRQRVGGHSHETCRLEMESLIIQCVCIYSLSTMLGPQDTAMNKIISVLQKGTVWWGERKSPWAKSCNKSYDRVQTRCYENSESDHGRLPGWEQNWSTQEVKSGTQEEAERIKG